MTACPTQNPTANLRLNPLSLPPLLFSSPQPIPHPRPSPEGGDVKKVPVPTPHRHDLKAFLGGRCPDTPDTPNTPNTPNLDDDGSSSSSEGLESGSGSESDEKPVTELDGGQDHEQPRVPTTNTSTLHTTYASSLSIHISLLHHTFPPTTRTLHHTFPPDNNPSPHLFPCCDNPSPHISP